MFEKMRRGVSNFFAQMTVQVTVFACALIVLACLAIFFFCRSTFTMIVMNAFEDKADIVYSLVGTNIDTDVYEDINDEEDKQTELYATVKGYLTSIRSRADIDDIFITKINNDSEVVYVVDIDSSYTNLRNPGDAAENSVEAITREVNKTCRVADDFVVTARGNRYLKAFPVRRGDRNVIGVIFIGMSSDDLIYGELAILIFVCIICLIMCIVTAIFAGKAFRKISNPFYQDASNTDALTDLKNKNSFTLDLHNIEGAGHYDKYGIIVVDLNGLKRINDTRGHQIGDRFIQKSAMVLKNCINDKSQVVYRIGGDEFTAIIRDCQEKDLIEIVKKVNAKIEEENEGDTAFKLSMAIGYALYDGTLDRNFSDTFQRADKMMYEVKQEHYRKQMEETGDSDVRL